MIFCFDRDGTLEPFGGPVPFSVLLELQRAGHSLATAGGAPGEQQTRDWRANGVEPDYIRDKNSLSSLLSLGESLVWVDDAQAFREAAEGLGFLFLTPQEFMERYREWL